MEGAEDNQQRELRFMRLENIPIENAFHEKKIFQEGEFARKLNPKYFSGMIAESENMRRGRIVEVYKRCFEESDPLKRPKVVRDFIAHFPHLAFEADWLKELVRGNAGFPNVADDGKKQILLAIANGFRSVARSTPREPATRKFYKVSGTRMALRTIQDELLRWNRALERDICPKEDIPALAAEKAEELGKTYGRLIRRDDKQRLAKFLEQGHCYEAAVLVASKVFGVRERDLESKLD